MEFSEIDIADVLTAAETASREPAAFEMNLISWPIIGDFDALVRAFSIMIHQAVNPPVFGVGVAL